MIEIRAELDFIVPTLCAPLESKGASLATIQDDLEKFSITPGHTCRFVPSHIKDISFPFSMRHVEQTFSVLEIVKTKRGTSLHISTLNYIPESSVEGPPLSSFKKMFNLTLCE